MCIVFLLRMYEWVLGGGGSTRTIVYRKWPHPLPLNLIITILSFISYRCVTLMGVHFLSMSVLFIWYSFKCCNLCGLFSRAFFCLSLRRPKETQARLLKRQAKKKPKEYFFWTSFCAFVILRQKYCNLS